MIVIDLLSPTDVVAGLRASSKAGLIAGLAARAAAALDLDGGTIRTALEKRETLGSTGIGGGIALPHARLDEVARPFALLARLRGPLDFDAIDEQPIDLVVLLLLPTNPAGNQLDALATIARRLRDPSVAEAMRKSRDAAGVYAAMCGTTPSRSPLNCITV
ncbi:MAG: PTS sugar transporter subunit IIA [Methylobacterium sp.]|uniref:PTS sugar transporter subunit IIA n=1 Tax=Methylobacterium sp. TaxID=409 RepID=UPI0025D1DD60|nr:PTS sugar transporter subunit IIA [Methylobacterium sp.]MBX9932610.1 PTS sugar transporter subunit IIA [Methylobacterium sp.]